MKARIMGIQRIDFVVEETGERICGSKLHVVSNVCENDTQMQGNRVAALWTKLDISGFKPGDLVELEYEQRLGSNKSFLSAISPAKG